MKTWFPFCVAAGLVGVGALAVLDPKKSATTYGLPSDDPATLGYVRGLGARDMVLGLAVFTRIHDAKPLVLLTSLVALADFAIIRTTNPEPPEKSLAIHGGGVLALLVGGLFLSASQDRRGA